MVCRRADFLKRDFLLVACKVIVRREEQHTVTFLALSHRHTGAIPKGSFGFSLLVFVVATGAER